MQGGARALGRIDGNETDQQTDVIVLDREHPLLYGKPAGDILDSFIFSGNDNLIRDVMAGGKWVIRDGVHLREYEITTRYKKTIRELNE